MRQEPRRIAGDRILVLADRQAARGMIDQPAADHRILVGEIRQRRQRLADKALGAIRALLLPPTVMPSRTSATLAPSREYSGLRTKEAPRLAAFGSSSKNAGNRLGWPGNISHSSGRMPLLERTAFQGGSIQRVGAVASRAPKSS